LTEAGEKVTLVRSGFVVSAPKEVTVTVAGKPDKLGNWILPTLSSKRTRLGDHMPGSAPFVMVRVQVKTPVIVVPDDGPELPHEAD
jgi:hypothetical protein